MSKNKLFRISRHAVEVFEVEAKDEDEALEIIESDEDEEPIHKEYYGDDEITEVT